MDWRIYVLLGFLAGLAVGFPLLSRRIREYRLSEAGLDNLALMTDEDMLRHMARLLGALGYRVYRPTWEDAGFQLILIDGLGQKRGVLIARWRSVVDEAVIQQTVAAAARLESTAPMIVTVEYYTWKAREEAERAGVILWTLRELTQAIGRVKQAAVAYPEIPAIRSAAMARQGIANIGAGGAGEAGAASAAGSAGAAAAGALSTLKEPLRAGRAAPWPAPLPDEEPWPDPLADEPPAPGSAQPERSWWRFGGKGPRLAKRSGKGPAPQEEVPRCPRCSMKMMVRRSSQGEYWGCPNFPRCLGSRPKL